MADAPHVALVHGWGGSYQATFRAAGWEESLRAHGVSPFGIDLPGHGPDGGSDNPEDYADMASALSCLIPEKVKRAIGFSLGTKLLLEMEARNPGRFDRLVLGGIGDNLFAPEISGEAVSKVLRGINPIGGASAIVQGLIRYAEKSESDPNALAAVLERTPNPVHNVERLSRVRAQILVVNALGDNIAMPDARLIAALPHVRQVYLPDGDHFNLPDNIGFRTEAACFLSTNIRRNGR